jgi:hypothetical protein
MGHSLLRYPRLPPVLVVFSIMVAFLTTVLETVPAHIYHLASIYSIMFSAFP